MRTSRLFAWILIPAGFALSGCAARAQSYYGGRQGQYSDPYYDRRDYGEDRRYAQVERLRADMARDQYQLNQALRRGDRNQAKRLSRDLNRDQRNLDKLQRDIARDRQRGRNWDRGYRNY